MSKTVRNRISWIKAIFCIMVVFVHAQNTDWFNVSEAAWIAQSEDMTAKSFAYLGVSGFFFVSGYLFFRNYRPSDLTAKLRRRFSSLVIPFLFWNLMTYLLYLFCSRAPGINVLFAGKDVPFTVNEFIEALLFYKYNPVFWFMQHLIMFMILTPLVSILIKNRWIGWIAVITAYVLSIYLYQNNDSHFIQTVYPYLQTFTGFLLGCHCGFHEHRLFEKERVQRISALLCAGFPVIMTAVCLHSGSIAALQTVRFTSGACLMAAAGAIQFPEPKNWFRYTFFIYSTHQLMLSFINKACAVLISANMYLGGILFCILPAAVIMICCFAAKMIETHTPRIAGLLGIAR